MATISGIPSNVTSDEIRSRIAELAMNTDEDNPFDAWENVEALEAELEARGEPLPKIWETLPEIP